MFYKCAQVTTRQPDSECTIYFFFACRDGGAERPKRERKCKRNLDNISCHGWWLVLGARYISMENNKFKYENLLPVHDHTHTHTLTTHMNAYRIKTQKYDSPMPFFFAPSCSPFHNIFPFFSSFLSHTPRVSSTFAL